MNKWAILDLFIKAGIESGELTFGQFDCKSMVTDEEHEKMNTSFKIGDQVTFVRDGISVNTICTEKTEMKDV